MPGNASASYTFTLQSDDGAMLYIDGVLLINNTGTASACRGTPVYARVQQRRNCAHLTGML